MIGREPQWPGAPVEALLVEAGFASRGACHVRLDGPVIQIVEPQRAVYAPRVTLNLGLSLSLLSSALPWASGRGGTMMSQAHRWVRLGRIMPEATDQWWDYGAEPAAAATAMAEALRAHGLTWLEHESRSIAFLRFAEQRRSRGASELNPEGTFQDLRLSIAVRCWRGEVDLAEALLGSAAAAWRLEHARLEHARQDFSASQDLAALPEAVPDLLAELEAMVRDAKRRGR